MMTKISLVNLHHHMQIQNKRKRKKIFSLLMRTLRNYSVTNFLFNFSFKKIYFWLYWVFVAARGLSLVAASGGYSSLRCSDFSLRWLLLWSTGSRRTGFCSCGMQPSVVVAHGLSCSVACGISPDQGSNPFPLH